MIDRYIGREAPSLVVCLLSAWFYHFRLNRQYIFDKVKIPAMNRLNDLLNWKIGQRKSIYLRLYWSSCLSEEWIWVRIQIPPVAPRAIFNQFHSIWLNSPLLFIVGGSLPSSLFAKRNDSITRVKCCHCYSDNFYTWRRGRFYWYHKHTWYLSRTLRITKVKCF